MPAPGTHRKRSNAAARVFVGRPLSTSKFNYRCAAVDSIFASTCTPSFCLSFLPSIKPHTAFPSPPPLFFFRSSFSFLSSSVLPCFRSSQWFFFLVVLLSGYRRERDSISRLNWQWRVSFVQFVVLEQLLFGVLNFIARNIICGVFAYYLELFGIFFSTLLDAWTLLQI